MLNPLSMLHIAERTSFSKHHHTICPQSIPRFSKVLGSIFCFVLICLAQASWAAPSDSKTAFQLQQFRPSLDPDGMFQTHGAKTLGQWGFLLGASLHYSWSPLFLTTERDQQQVDVITHQTGLDLGLGVGILPFLDIAVNLPMSVYQVGRLPQLDILGRASGRSLEGFFLSDIKIRARLQALQQKQHGINLSFQPTIGLPTGDDNTFNGEGKVSFSMAALLSRRLSRFEFAINFGYRYLPETQFLGLVIGHELFYSAGIGIDLLPKKLQIIADLHGIIGLSGAGDRNNSPMSILAGVRIFPMGSRLLALHMGIGTGILGGYGSPGFRGFLTIVWHPKAKQNTRTTNPDRDRDGIFDANDQCPNKAGPRSNRGCPVKNNDRDRDRDGVPDSADRCPSQFGTRANAGCPSPLGDKDNDGILDNKDKCPNVAGPISNLGCPRRNTPPPSRRVASTKEPNLSKRDRDGDGLLDSRDRCPGLPGSKRRRGCPRKVLIKMSARKRRIYIRRRVKFRTSTRMYYKTKQIFKQLARLMKSFPTMRIRIVATTYARSRRSWVKRRSYYQARSIRNYVRKRGISSKRISIRARRRYRRRRSIHTAIRIYILHF